MNVDKELDQLLNDDFLDVIGQTSLREKPESGTGTYFQTNDSDTDDPDNSIMNRLSDELEYDSSSNEQIQMMDIYQVEPDREQPRHHFDPEKLQELSASIQQFGLLQPLLVQQADGYYKIIAGERRYRAARMAGLTQIPVIIKNIDDQERMAIALIENLQREDLNPMEECNAYQKLMDEYHLTQEQISEKLGKSRSSIANSLRLQNLPEAVQKNISEGLLSLGHAKVLLGIDDQTKQLQLALKVIGEQLSVRELEDLLHQKTPAPKKEKKSVPQQSLPIRLAQQQLSETLGCKVQVTKGVRKGKIEIDFYNEEDLERILSLLKS